MSREDVAEFSRVNLPRADYLAEESPIDLLEAVSLEGATRRNATGEEASERVVDECCQEAKRATMPYRYSPEVLRVRMSDTRRRAAL
jgi:hypothetical protein